MEMHTAGWSKKSLDCINTKGEFLEANAETLQESELEAEL